MPVLAINVFSQGSILRTNMLVLPPYLPEYLIFIAYTVFFAVNTFVIERFIRQIEKFNVIDLLWKLLVIGITGISITFLFRILQDYMKGDVLHPEVYGIAVSVNLYSLFVFLLSAIFIYRKLILYQKNKRKVQFWRAFQVVLLFAVVRIFMEDGPDLTNLMLSIILPAFFLLAMLLAANVNWSAYLNINQKLRSLFLIFIIGLLFMAYYYSFPFDALHKVGGFLELMSSRFLFLGLVFLFPLIYTLFSGLVLIFNLPTSSVFEQRSSELATIQAINQSIQANLEIDKILKTLMDASWLTSNATGGWIESLWEVKEGPYNAQVSEIPYFKNITPQEIEELRRSEDLTAKVIEERKPQHVRNLKKHKTLRFARTRIKSLLAIPILTRDHPVGVLYLINELPSSFEEETIVSLIGLAEQAGVAIENGELFRESIKYERYTEQLKIAKEVQEQILPKTLPSSAEVEFFVVSQEVEEIGGDYYDVHPEEGTFKVALGDVSGKGTTAAFYMAETKGIFQALAHIDLDPKAFIVNANKALSRCLKLGSFMTLTYLHIDTVRKQVAVMRAGHCPTLFYHADSDSLTEHEHGGPGLAIIRDGSYGKMIPDPEIIPYQSGDLLILYTDGIMEARNGELEEFGIARMKEIIYSQRRAPGKIVAESLLSEVKKFTGGAIEDDYTLLVIRFN